jgi:hypothetical protein
MPLQIRRGTEAERIAMVPKLANGELLWITDDKKLYIGDGTTASSALASVTGFTTENAQDAAASLFTTTPAHSGISFVYDDFAGTLTATVNLSDYTGDIKASAFKGTFVADDSSILVDGVAGVLKGTLQGSLTGNVTGNVTGNITGNLSGNVTGNTTGYHTGDVTGSVFADDSTILVDAVDGLIRGDIDNLNVSTGDIVIDKDLAAGGILIRSEASLEDDVDIFNIVTAHNDASASGLTFTRSRGTIAAPTALTTDNNIFSLVFAGQSSTTVEPAVRFDVKLDGSVGSATVPGKVAIATADSAGTMTDRLIIDSKGISAFTGMVQLPTFADETAANAAVTTPVNGMMYYDSGAGKIKGRQGGAWVVLQP